MGFDRGLEPPIKPMPEDTTEATLDWIRRGFTPSEVFSENDLMQWAHSNNYLTIEEYLEWERFNQHITLVDYCKSLNK